MAAKPDIKALATAVAHASGWVKTLGDLNEALQPFVTEDLALEKAQAAVEALTAKRAALEQEIVLRETYLVNVNDRITLADDARAKQLDADLDDYRRSIESKKRGLDASLDQVQAHIDALDAQIPDKTAQVQALDDAIADKRRALDQVKADLAAVIASVKSGG